MKKQIAVMLCMLLNCQFAYVQITLYPVWQKTFDATEVSELNTSYYDDTPGLVYLNKSADNSYYLYVDVYSSSNISGLTKISDICVNEFGDPVQTNAFGIHRSSDDKKVLSDYQYYSGHNFSTGNIEIGEYNHLFWKVLIDHPVTNPKDKISDWCESFLPTSEMKGSKRIYLLGELNGTISGTSYLTACLNASNGEELWRQTRSGKPEAIFAGQGSNLTPIIYVTGTSGTAVYSSAGSTLADLNEPASGMDVLADSRGNVYVAGIVHKYIYFNQHDVQLVKYNNDFTKDWEYTYDMDADDDMPYMIKFDKELNVILVANGCATRRSSVSGECNKNSTVFIKITPQGKPLWISVLGEFEHDITDIVFDVDANIYFIKDQSKLVKINGSDGTLAFEKVIQMKGAQGEILNPVASQMEIDIDGNIYVVGTIGSLYNPPPNQLISNTDVVIQKYAQLEDMDKDEVPNIYDNCPQIHNPGQEDVDGDGVGDKCDNCPSISNNKQSDVDGDKIGDLCDNCQYNANDDQKDRDYDGTGDVCDNCLNIYNQDQADADGDKVGDICDNCVSVSNREQLDTDLDGKGDACDDDDDNDGILDIVDNCDVTKNIDQKDTDKDGVGDACNSNIDKDGDDWCDRLDNCSRFPNSDQQDEDHNGIGDACESHLSIDHIEVTQGIQDGNIPLIYGKPTYVRVFYNVGIAKVPIGPISGYIRLYYSNGLPMLTYNCGIMNSPIYSYNRITAMPNPDPANRDHSLNFVIPAGCQWDGTPYIRVFTFYHGKAEDLPEQYTMPVHQPVPLQYTSTEKFNLTFVPVDLDVCHTPGDNDFFRALDYVKKIFPVSKFDIRKASTLNHWGDPTNKVLGVAENGAQLISELQWINFFTNDAGSNRKYYGLVCSEVNPCESLANPLAGDVTGMGIFDEAWGIFDGYSVHGAIMPHELIHTWLGIGHVMDNCDSMWPYYENYTGGSDGSLEPGIYGFDGTNTYPYYSYKDVMTYCNDQWISAYTYKGLINAFSNKKKSTDREIHYLSQKKNAESDGYFIINGYIETNEGKLSATIKKLEASNSSSEDPLSEFACELLNSSGIVIEDYQVALNETSNGGSLNTFFAALPYNSTAKAIRFRYKNEILKTVPISANEPMVKLTSPNGGEKVSDSFTVSWQASDADGDKLTYDVIYSTDNGASWMPLELSVDNTSISWESQQTAGSENALIRVIAYDEVNSSSDESDAVFSVTQKSPLVYISKPAEGDTLFFKQWLNLEANYYDPEDGGDLNDTIRFFSQMDGLLGSGNSIYVDSLIPGTHQIVAAIRDNTGLEGSDTVTVVVLEAIDTDSDLIPDNIDNCPEIYNPGQEDHDSDHVGDQCEEDDTDEDGFVDRIDNCLMEKNNQTDSDGDGKGDTCDDCPYLPVANFSIVGADYPEEGSLQTYRIEGDTAVQFTWYLPMGWEIIEKDSATIVKVGKNGGVILVIPRNECGVGSPAEKAVIVKPVEITGAFNIVQDNTGLILYPNPGNEYIRFKSSGADVEDITWFLRDNSGHLLGSGKWSNSPEEIYIGHLPPSVYYLQITSHATNASYTFKLIKK